MCSLLFRMSQWPWYQFSGDNFLKANRIAFINHKLFVTQISLAVLLPGKNSTKSYNSLQSLFPEHRPYHSTRIVKHHRKKLSPKPNIIIGTQKKDTFGSMIFVPVMYSVKSAILFFVLLFNIAWFPSYRNHPQLDSNTGYFFGVFTFLKSLPGFTK